jgi:hypothetical protein
MLSAPPVIGWIELSDGSLEVIKFDCGGKMDVREYKKYQKSGLCVRSEAGRSKQWTSSVSTRWFRLPVNTL